jgi:hypothetical protein
MTELELADTPTRSELSEADFRECRWISGEPLPLRSGMFCCAPTRPGSSWCERHHGVVWRATTRQRAILRKSGAARVPGVPQPQISHAQNASLGLDTPNSTLTH